MSSPRSSPAARGQQARLLALIIAVSAGVLVLLAQFRFPEEGRIEAPPAPAPLERLAARATYDELASIVAKLERRVVPMLVVLKLAPADAGPPRFVPALRVRRELALVRLVSGERPEAIVGSDAAPLLLGLDPLNRVAAVRVPPSSESARPFVEDAGEAAGPRYVTVVEGSPGGIVVRPVFLGRTLHLSDPKWSAPLTMLGAALPAQEGALVFSIEGRFVGMTVIEQGVPALAPPEALLAQVERLARGSPAPPVELGIEVQALTPVVAAASGAARGVVVAHVEPRGPAHAILQVTDVIERVGDQPVTSPDGLRVLLSRVSAAAPLTLGLVRRGKRLEVSVASRAPPATEVPADTGLLLRVAPREGALVLDVRAGSPASAAGIRAGDLVAYIEGRPAPTPRQVTQAFAALPPRGLLLLGVRQREGHRVVALRKP